jgi:hypothetical protein
LAALRGRLEAFAEDAFETSPRKDQGARDECYPLGLILEGRRKSIEPMPSASARSTLGAAAVRDGLAVELGQRVAAWLRSWSSSCPLGWRLFAPEHSDDAAMAERRAACHRPEQVRHRRSQSRRLPGRHALRGDSARCATVLNTSRRIAPLPARMKNQ